MVMKTPFKILFAALLLSSTNVIVAQTNTATPEAKEVDEFAKKPKETKLTEVIPTDSVPVSELMKRALAWAKLETNAYKKGQASNSDGKLELIASFPVKPKELNPQVDYTGKVTMKVVIECKVSKFRYTVSEIKHVAKNGRSSGGSVDLEVPECGSMGLTDLTWKKLKGEMLAGAAKVAADIKIAMMVTPVETKPEEW
jgi:hypothetical protein